MLTRLTSAAAQKAAQNPATCMPGQHPRDQRHHAGVDHQQEQPESDDGHRQSQHDGDGPHDGIDDPERYSGENQGQGTVDGNAGHPHGGQPQAERH